MRLAIAGATGNVGREVVRLLEETQSVHIDGSPILLGSTVSIGEEIDFNGDSLSVEPLKDFAFEKIDVIVFATDAEISKAYIPAALEKKIQVVDLSSAYRADEGVPMIVDAVNGASVQKDTKHLSIADAATLQLASVLNVITKEISVKRVNTTVMYPVSRAGKAPMGELFAQSAGLLGGAGGEGMDGEFFKEQVAFNVIPKVGEFVGSNTDVETGLLLELNRVLKSPVPVLSTSVYVPTFVGISQSVTLDFNGAITASDVKTLLEKADGISVIDNPEQNEYSTPYGTAETSQIFVSRIRENPLAPGTIQLWVTCDNLRTGSALQVVKVLERLN